MFSDLFRPKWEHSDPRVRRKALESGAVPTQLLAALAGTDSDPQVRRSALGRLQDLDVLTGLIGADPEKAVRDAARCRLCELLVAAEQDGPALEQRLKAVEQLPSCELHGELARRAQLAEVRAAALQRVQDTALLCELAVDDPVAAVRRAALERIDAPDGWERVAREARHRDKQISRMARERLEAFRTEGAEQENAVQLSLAMEALASAAVGAATRAEFQRLRLQWDKLGCVPPAPVSQRFARAGEVVSVAVERFESLLRQRRGLCAELETLLADLRGSEGQDQGPDSAEPWRDIRARWGSLDADGAADEALAEQFNGLLTQVQQEAERLDRDAACAARLRSVLDQGRAALDDSAELDERRVKDFKRRWHELERPQSRHLAEQLKHDFDSLQHALRERLNRQVQQRKQALEEAEHFMTELEQSLDKGELEHALSLRDRIRHRLKLARGLDERKRAAVQRRLHAVHPQLDRLRDWRHWGSGQSRERLCSEMEALAEAVLEASEVASRVRNAREAWKHIDRAEGPAGEALWQRFDTACTRAYAPYQQQRREHMAELEVHRERKQALCDELEAMERDTDWKNVDWSEADRRARSLRQRWRRIGPVPRKAGKGLEQRYRAALERLDSHLGRERERELRRRRALIAQIEALAGAEDARAASREVKQAQKDWKPTVQADKRTEQALWQQFRTACDAVFNRIGEQREASERERQAGLQRRQTLCDELEALLNDAGADFQAVTRRFADADDEWSASGPLPRKAEQGVQARFQALKKAFAERQKQATLAAAEAELDGIRERSVLCERLEAGAMAGSLDESERQAVAQRWEALPGLAHEAEPLLRKRFELAARALSGDPGAQQQLQRAAQDNLDRRLDLCLQMEIEAGVESPAEFADARMQLQVSRLEDAFKHRQGGAAGDRARALQIAWYLCGPLPAAERAALDARFAGSLAALKKA
jgi:hypothetical protein